MNRTFNNDKAFLRALKVYVFCPELTCSTVTGKSSFMKFNTVVLTCTIAHNLEDVT